MWIVVGVEGIHGSEQPGSRYYLRYAASVSVENNSMDEGKPIGGSGMRPGRTDKGGEAKAGHLGEWWVSATKWRRSGAVTWRNGRREGSGKRQVINRSEWLSTYKGDLSTESGKV